MSTEKLRTKARLLRLTDESVQSAPQPARIMIVSVTGEVGGAERSLYEVASALPRGTLDIQACCPPHSPLALMLRSQSIPVHEIPFRRFRRTANPLTLAGQLRALYKGASELSLLCKQQQIELIHANTDSAAITAWEAARATQIPFVWHCRDIRPLHGLARVVSSSACAVVAISFAVEQHLRREGVRAEKIRRIDNGIDLARFSPRAEMNTTRALKRAELGIRINQPVLLTVGGMVPWKRHEKFLDLLASVRARIPDAVGILVGSDQFSQNEEYVRSLQAHARKLALTADGLQMLEHRDDIPALMAASDVLVSCSENEPFGRVLAEAGAAALPVVSTRSGGKSEIIEEFVTGMLASQNDSAELLQMTMKLLNDPTLREQMGQMARMRIERLYDVKRTAQELAALFEQLVSERRAQSHV